MLARVAMIGAAAWMLACGAGVPRAETALPVRAVVRPDRIARLARSGRPAPAAASPGEMRIQSDRERRWRSFPDVLCASGIDWVARARQPRLTRRAASAPRRPRLAMAAARLETPPDTVRVAFIRIDFRSDRGGGASTGDGHFDLRAFDPTQVPIDPSPHDRAFFQQHLEALSRYYSAMSYGRVVITGDVWPRTPNGAYSLSDMADYGPWTFSQEIYRAAVHMYRDMFFAADSQAADTTLFNDPIPWDSYDDFVLIHAGSDLQDDVKQDSKEDIPSFTLTVGDTDRVIFSDSTNVPIDHATIVPESIAQDGYYGSINGVIAHESGHNLFGLADLYDVETGLPVVGEWSLMDSGNLVGARVPFGPDTLYATGLLPPSVDPWQRFYLTDALAFPEVSYDSAPIAIENSERHPDVRRVTLSSDEYLLLENRWISPPDSTGLTLLDQDTLTHVILGPKGPDRFEYDALLAGPGVLVWHIDESVIPFTTSLRANADYGFNTDPARLGISVIEGDGLQDLGDTGSPYFTGAPSDPWFVSNNPALSDSTFPNLIPHVGTRPHKRLDFPDDPDSTMHITARRTWELPGWPVAADFPPGGPLLLAVDADGDRALDVCWAGGRDSIDVKVGNEVQRLGDPDSAALFAVRADGLALDSSRVHAFAHLDRRPRPEMAAIPTGESPMPGQPAVGPAYFAVSTYAAGADTSSPGGRVWLIDHHGQTVPGWPAPLPSIVTTPPVIAGRYPNAIVFAGCADGRVYAIGLDGHVVAKSDPLAGAISGRLAVEDSPPHPFCPLPPDLVVLQNLAQVAAGSEAGDVAVITLVRRTTDTLFIACGQPLAREGFVPEFLWIPFDGAAPQTLAATPPGETCGKGVSALVVHEADKLWAFCPGWQAIAGWGHSFGDTIDAGLGAGDPDGDGLPKVLFQNVHSGLAFVNRTGSPAPGWPKPGTTEGFRTDSPPLVLDVDGDGRGEVVGMNASGIVAAIRADGRTPEGWPLASGSGATGSPVAADLRRDGGLDLVVPDRFGMLYAYTLLAGASDPLATSWTMLGGDPGRSSALPAGATPVTPGPVPGPLADGTLVAYPNPARRHPVTFAFRLTEPADVEYRILDTSGHQVASFSRSALQGENVQTWEPGNLPAGLYLARLRFHGGGHERVAVLQVGLLR